MPRPFSLLTLLFCCASLFTLAGTGQPHSTFLFTGVNTAKMITDSVPVNQAPAPENSDAAIKEVPKARKQVKPVDLEKTPVAKTIIKPVLKPVIKPAVKPVIKPVIRIH